MLIFDPDPNQLSARQEHHPVPPDLEAAFENNAELRDALMQSDMPLRFQAMVLGLATLKQANSGRRRS